MLSVYSFSPRVTYVGLALLGLTSLGLLYAVDPRNPGSYPVCPFLGLTGVLLSRLRHAARSA